MRTSGRGHDTRPANPLLHAVPSDAIRECTVCPKWVVRCVHFPDERRMWLYDKELVNWENFAPQHNQVPNFEARWVVAGPVLMEPCRLGDGHQTLNVTTRGGHYATDTRALADAEFDRRAESLRIGGSDE